MAADGEPALPERLVFGPVTILVREDAASTGGAMSIFEELPPMVDTPLHVHSREDELFYALEGEHVVRRGDDEFTLAPGDSIFLPRGVPHSQRRVVPGVGRQLVVCAPAGFDYRTPSCSPSTTGTGSTPPARRCSRSCCAASRRPGRS